MKKTASYEKRREAEWRRKHLISLQANRARLALLRKEIAAFPAPENTDQASDLAFLQGRALGLGYECADLARACAAEKKPAIHSKRTVWEDYRFGDSGTTEFVVRWHRKPDARVMYALNLNGYSCNCVHDCCGHMQYRPGHVERRLKRNEWVVSVHWYRNC